MLCDKRQDIRKLAVSRIISVRPFISRKFALPTLNFDAKDYVNLMHWSDCVIKEPPLTKSMSQDDIESFTKENVDYHPFQHIFNLPCHTQAVVRCVKEVTAASYQVLSSDARDKVIRASFYGRKTIPAFETKFQI